MTTDLPLRCACGSFRAVIHGVSPKTVNRVVCCCSGCQTYAQTMGRAHEILDQHGGTDVFQASPASLVITEGRNHLACLQQTQTGAFRWHARCCDSPIANTLPSMDVPFMAVIHTIVDRSQLDRPLDDLLGPVRACVNGRFDKPLAKQLHATRWALVKMLCRYAPMLLRWRLRGDHRRWAFTAPAMGPKPGEKRVVQRAGCG